MKRFLLTTTHSTKRLYHNLPTKFIPLKASSHIKNMDLPACVDCVHYLEYYQQTPYDDIERGKCKLFGKKHLITGQIDYYYAEECRMDDKYRCGEKGFFFEKLKEDEEEEEEE